jgi:transcriptional regulator with XRE-family HTH domain
LGHVLRSSRDLLGRSPEQVGMAIGISGRTLRRLEIGAVRRPRLLTLESLAGYYALDPSVLSYLVEWADLDEEELLARLTELDESELAAGETLESVAMRLGRRGGGRIAARRQAQRANDVEALVEDFLGLDRRRRTLVRALAAELRSAQAHEASGR